jgi:hypothetical protein
MPESIQGGGQHLHKQVTPPSRISTIQVQLYLHLIPSCSFIMQPTDCPEASQWLFPIPALLATPTIMTSGGTLEKELYDRGRGVEFLFRLGSSLQLFVIAIVRLIFGTYHVS